MTLNTDNFHTCFFYSHSVAKLSKNAMFQEGSGEGILQSHSSPIYAFCFFMVYSGATYIIMLCLCIWYMLFGSMYLEMFTRVSDQTSNIIIIDADRHTRKTIHTTNISVDSAQGRQIRYKVSHESVCYTFFLTGFKVGRI